MRGFFWAPCGLLAAGCSYDASVPVRPAAQVYSSYDEKLPGRYTLHVDASALAREQRVSCLMHAVTFDARGPFRDSVEQTVALLVEEATPVEQPLSADELRAQGYDGQILVEAHDIDVDLRLIERFWTVDAEAEVELTAGVRVESADGLLVREIASAEDEAESNLGMACSNADEAVSNAMGKSLARLMQQVGEVLANEPSLRQPGIGTRQTTRALRPGLVPSPYSAGGGA